MATKPADSTLMFSEAAQAASVVQAQLDQHGALFRQLGEQLRKRPPAFLLTCARGSSDHAASYAKYLLETWTGTFTVSAGPSVNSVYQASMNFRDSVALVISQSGASPDLLAFARAARRGGARVIALVNVADSPLASEADDVIELLAGPETSVAATKSFIASLSATAQLVAAWKQDQELAEALAGAPDKLAQAWECDWSPAIPPIQNSHNLFVLGRGLGLGIAQEAALKFKEVCALHAEAYSSAEVLHGPVTIARPAFPALLLAQNDATRPGVQRLLESLTDRGVQCITAGVEHPDAINLPFITAHPVVEPMLRIQSFYRMANRLSLLRGLDPDSPPFLNKVTSTV